MVGGVRLDPTYGPTWVDRVETQRVDGVRPPVPVPCLFVESDDMGHNSSTVVTTQSLHVSRDLCRWGSVGRVCCTNRE